MDEVTVPVAVPLKTIPGVELAAVGQWDASTGTTTFTREDFASAVSAMDCPGVRNPVIKLGHDEPDSTSGIRWDGEPAVGWIGNMRLDAAGNKILGDYSGMPEWLADVLPTAYPDRSIEIYRPFVCQIGHLHPAVITAVALLGVMRPGVGVIQSLQDVQALFTTAGTMRPQVAKLTSIRVGDRVVFAAAQEPLRRQLTQVEEQAKTDFLTVQWQWESSLDRLAAAWSPVRSLWNAELVEQVEQLVRDDDLPALAKLTVDTTQAQELIRSAMVEMTLAAQQEMRGEAARQGVVVPVKTSAAEGDAEWGGLDATLIALIKRVSKTVTALMAAGYAFATGKRGVQAATPTSKAEDVAAIVAGYLDELSGTPTRDQLGVALSTAQNAGRISVMSQAPRAAYYASEVLDAKTCKNCNTVDGRRFADLEEVQASYTNGGYVDCLGHLRCRGTVIALWDELAAVASAPRIHIPISFQIEGAGSAEDRRIRLR